MFTAPSFCVCRILTYFIVGVIQQIVPRKREYTRLNRWHTRVPSVAEEQKTGPMPVNPTTVPMHSFLLPGDLKHWHLQQRPVRSDGGRAGGPYLASSRHLAA